MLDERLTQAFRLVEPCGLAADIGAGALTSGGTTTIAGEIISKDKIDTHEDDEIPPKEGGEDAQE